MASTPPPWWSSPRARPPVVRTGGRGGYGCAISRSRSPPRLVRPLRLVRPTQVGAGGPATDVTAASALPSLDSDASARLSVTCRLLSGREVASQELGLRDPIRNLRHAVANAEGCSTDGPVSPSSIDLVVNGRQLFNKETVEEAGLSDGADVLVVRVQPFQILVSSERHAAELWDGVTGDVVRSFRGHHNALKSAAFSLCGGKVITASDDFNVRIFDAARGYCTATLRHRNNVNSACFSSDSSLALTACDDGTAKLFDVASKSCIVTYRGHQNVVNTAAFTANTRNVLTGSDDGRAKLFDVETSQCVTTFSHLGDAVRSVACLPKVGAAGAEGATTASLQYLVGSDDGVARLLCEKSGRCERELRGHEDSVRSVTFSPDGSQVLTGSQDGTARLFRVSSGQCEETLRGHGDFVCSAVFSGDGLQALTASDDGHVRLFSLDGVSCLRTYDVGGEVRTAMFAPSSPVTPHVGAVA
eukprot:TRINITY_DN51994_c0_g1_i1.p1 TRINITY_DN51994_c0_g1~~TRINITY_DN51994_c0_g1_i1.p1  ORF type:complete len:473 (+),score=59.02 TRINITY_DN51994_c0_g1_i1:51-1469(+)